MASEKLQVSDKTPLFSESSTLTRIKPSKWRQTIVLLACMYLHFMSLGFAAALGVLYVELIRQFNSARSETAIVQSMYQGLTYVGGIVFSRIVTKVGVGPSVIFSSTLCTIAFFISAFSVNIYMVIVLVGFIGGLSMSVNYLCAFVAVGWTFLSNRRAALAFLTVATAVGQAALPNLVEALIKEYGWSGTYIVASGLILNSVPCGLYLYFSKDFFLRENKSNTASSLRERFCQCHSKQDLAYVLFVIGCLIFSGTSAVESWFIVDLSELRGLTRQEGTSLLSCMGVFGLVGRLLGTMLLKFYPAIKISVPLGVAFVFAALSHYLVIYLTDFLGMLGGLFIRGLSMGTVMCLIPGMQLELRGINRFPQTMALCNVMIGASLVVCGYFGGYIADRTGGYDLAFYIAVIVSLFCGLIMATIRHAISNNSHVSVESLKTVSSTPYCEV